MTQKIRDLAEELGADSEAMFEEHGTHIGSISEREEKKHFGSDHEALKEECDELAWDYAQVAMLAMMIGGFRPRVVMASLWSSGFMIGCEWKERQLREEGRVSDNG